MSFEQSPKRTESASEQTKLQEARVLLNLERLRALAAKTELKVTERAIGALGRVDAVFSRLPRPVQEFVTGYTVENVGGLPIAEKNLPKDGTSIIDGLFGISHVTNEVRKRASN
jgi:hypothetical protein